jgi:hypothetical protein
MIMRSKAEQELARQWRWVKYLMQIKATGTPMYRHGEPTPEFIAFTAIERMCRDD